MARWAATASTSSIVWVGTRVMRLGRPGWWPDRPARCNSRATPLAEPICSTRETGKKSTPRSSDEVATTASRLPAFSPASTHSRTALSSEPWCSAMRPAQSGRAASSIWYQASACERTLVNTRVQPSAWLRAISSTTGWAICAPRWPAQVKRPGSAGSRVSINRVLSIRPRTRAGAWAPEGRGPSSIAIAAARLPSVADRPQTTSAGFQTISRASSNCVCTPRLLPTSSCHSSTITVCTPRKRSAASARDISSVADSGVVTSTVGRRRSCRARSADDVSPLRRPSDQSGARSASGKASARWVSAASARMGVSHRTASGGAGALRTLERERAVAGAGAGAGAGAVARAGAGAGAGAVPSVRLVGLVRLVRPVELIGLGGPAGPAGTAALPAAARCKAPSATARVLPAPVVACSRPLRPCAMAAHTSR